MQIVIDISEKDYNYYRDTSNFWGYSKLREIILKGTPLPKGHGRLIYAKDVGEYLTLADVPTIIEADKGE